MEQLIAALTNPARQLSVKRKQIGEVQQGSVLKASEQRLFILGFKQLGQIDLAARRFETFPLSQFSSQLQCALPLSKDNRLIVGGDDKKAVEFSADLAQAFCVYNTPWPVLRVQALSEERILLLSGASGAALFLRGCQDPVWELRASGVSDVLEDGGVLFVAAESGVIAFDLEMLLGAQERYQTIIQARPVPSELGRFPSLRNATQLRLVNKKTLFAVLGGKELVECEIESGAVAHRIGFAHEIIFWEMQAKHKETRLFVVLQNGEFYWIRNDFVVDALVDTGAPLSSACGKFVADERGSLFQVQLSLEE